MKTDSALGRSKRRVVVDAIAKKDLGPTIVHQGRNGNDESPSWVPETLMEIVIKFI